MGNGRVIVTGDLDDRIDKWVVLFCPYVILIHPCAPKHRERRGRDRKSTGVLSVTAIVKIVLF